MSAGAKRTPPISASYVATQYATCTYMAVTHKKATVSAETVTTAYTPGCPEMKLKYLRSTYSLVPDTKYQRWRRTTAQKFLRAYKAPTDSNQFIGRDACPYIHMDNKIVITDSSFEQIRRRFNIRLPMRPKKLQELYNATADISYQQDHRVELYEALRAGTEPFFTDSFTGTNACPYVNIDQSPEALYLGSKNFEEIRELMEIP